MTVTEAGVGVGVLSPKQKLSLSESTGRVNIWEGSVRSGKTIASIIRFLLFVVCWGIHHRGELVIVGRTRDSVWRNIISPMQDPAITGRTARAVVGNFGAPTVSIFGRRVHIMGASDAKAEKVLRGMTVLGAYVDEITTIPEEFFAQLLARMSPPGARMFGTTNPDSPGHWFKKKYLGRLPANWRSWHFVLDDNPGLTESYKNSIKREYSGLWYRRFILGEWVAADGAIFDMFDPSVGVVSELPPDLIEVSLGIDYGTTNPTRGELLCVSPSEGRLYVTKEWTPAKGTDSSLSRSLQRWMLREGVGERGDLWLPVDPAAASFRLQLFEDRVDGVVAASNDVLPGIQLLSSLFGRDLLRIHKSCKELITYLPGYVWDPKKTEKGEDAPIKEDDHEIDALRYAVYSTRAEWKQYVDMATIEGTGTGYGQAA